MKILLVALLLVGCGEKINATPPSIVTNDNSTACPKNMTADANGNCTYSNPIVSTGTATGTNSGTFAPVTTVASGTTSAPSQQQASISQAGATDGVTTSTLTHAAVTNEHNSDTPPVVGNNQLSLDASIDYTSSPNLYHDGQMVFQKYTAMYMPKYITVLQGSGSDGQATITLDKIQCTYQATADIDNVLSPYNAEQEYYGRWYEFVTCTGAVDTDNLIQGKTLTLSVLSANPGVVTQVQALFSVEDIGE